MAFIGARRGHPFLVQCRCDPGEPLAIRIEREDSVDDLGLPGVGRPSNAPSPWPAVQVNVLRIGLGDASIAIGQTASAEILQGLPFKTAVGLPPKLSDVLSVNGPVDSEKEVSVLPVGIEGLIDEIEPDAAKSQITEQ